MRIWLIACMKAGSCTHIHIMFLFCNETIHAEKPMLWNNTENLAYLPRHQNLNGPRYSRANAAGSILVGFECLSSPIADVTYNAGMQSPSCGLVGDYVPRGMLRLGAVSYVCDTGIRLPNRPRKLHTTSLHARSSRSSCKKVLTYSTGLMEGDVALECKVAPHHLDCCSCPMCCFQRKQTMMIPVRSTFL